MAIIKEKSIFSPTCLYVFQVWLKSDKLLAVLFVIMVIVNELIVNKISIYTGQNQTDGLIDRRTSQ